jgi:hypothetical protein
MTGQGTSKCSLIQMFGSVSADAIGLLELRAELIPCCHDFTRSLVSMACSSQDQIGDLLGMRHQG